jgi:hypothetical protein
MPTLAPTTFQTGPNDQLAVVDVYSQMGVGTLNSIQSITASIKDAEVRYLDRKPVLSAEMAGMLSDRILKYKNGKLSVDFGAVMRTLINSNPELLAAYRSLSTAYQVTMANVKAVENLVEVSVGAAKKLLHTVEYGDVASLANMALVLATGSNEVPNFLFKDLGGLTYLANKLIVEAAAIGLSGIYRPLCSSDAFAGEPMRNLTRSLVRPILDQGNHELLYEVCSNGGAGYIIQARPSFISDFLANYKLQHPTQDECWSSTGRYMDQEWASLSASFDLLDPHWCHAIKTRSDGDGTYGIFDITVMMNAADGAYASARLCSNANAPVLSQYLQFTPSTPAEALTRLNAVVNPTNAYILSLMSHFPRTDVMSSLRKEMPLVHALKS